MWSAANCGNTSWEISLGGVLASTTSFTAGGGVSLSALQMT
nr:hypothetical protein [Brevibacillus parabrevis]